MTSSVIKTSVKATCPHRNVTFNAETSDNGSPGIVDLSKFFCNDCQRPLAANFGRGWVLQIATLLKPVDELPPQPAAKTVKKKPEPAPQEPPKTLREQIGDGPGTELAEELERLGVSSCQACKQQAVVMNTNGPQWCRENVDALVADILPRARAWADHATLQEKMGLWWKADMGLLDRLKSGAKAATWQLDESLKVAIRSRVLAAVERWEFLAH